MLTYGGPRQPPVGSQTSARFAYTNQAFVFRAHRHAVRRAEQRAGPLAVAPACVVGWPSPEPGGVGDAPPAIQARLCPSRLMSAAGSGRLRVIPDDHLLLGPKLITCDYGQAIW